MGSGKALTKPSSKTPCREQVGHGAPYTPTAASTNDHVHEREVLLHSDPVRTTQGGSPLQLNVLEEKTGSLPVRGVFLLVFSGEAPPSNTCPSDVCRFTSSDATTRMCSKSQ